MADRNFSTLVPRVNGNVSGCPYPTIEQHIRDAAIEVCSQTLAYRYEIPRFNLTPGVHEYTFNVPTNTEVHAIFAAIMNDRPLALLNLDAAIRQHPEWADLYSGEDSSVVWSETPSGAIGEEAYNEGTFNSNPDFVVPDAIVADGGTPRTLTQVSPDKYIVLPLPDNDATYAMRMFVALKPLRSATAMQENAFSELEDVVFHRACQTLLLMPNTPWFDGALATYHGKQYTYFKSERRARANLGNNRGSLSVQMRRFA